MISQAELILRVMNLWFLVLSQVFRNGMGHFKRTSPVFALLLNQQLCDTESTIFNNSSMLTSTLNS